MRTIGIVCALSLIAAGSITWVANGTATFGNFLYESPRTPQVGDQFMYTPTFDSESPDTDASPFAGNYPGAIQSATFSIGDESVDLPAGPGSFVITTLGTFPSLYSRLDFSSTSPLSFDTDALPSMLPTDLGIYDNSFASAANLDSERANGTASVPGFFGQVSSVVQKPASVPEPATAVLLATGLLGMALARRRRRGSQAAHGRPPLSNVLSSL